MKQRLYQERQCELMRAPMNRWIQSRSASFAYLFATAAVLVAWALRAALNPILDNNLAYETQFVAVMAASWIGGLRPGIWAVTFSTLLTWFHWLGPATGYAFDVKVTVSLALYVVSAGLIAFTVQAMRKAELDLMRERNQFQVILASIDDAVITVDLDGRIGFINARAEQLLGRSNAEVKDLAFADVVRLIDRPSLQIITDLRPPETASGMTCTLTRDAVLIGANGREIPVRDRLAPLRGDDQRILGSALTLTDASLQKRYEADQALAEIRKDEFLAILAHELRNPLNPLQSAVSMLRLSSQDSVARADALAIIQRQVDQLVRLVDDLMDVSRIRSGRLELRQHVIDFDQVVGAAVEAVRPLIESRRQRFELLAGPAAKVRGDAARLTQVLTNVLNNASKYTAAGGWICLSTSVEKNEVRVKIADGGIGLTAEDTKRIFELFTRGGDGSQSIEGLGIGLALARRLLEMQDGRIEAESKGPGCGASFSIVLPISHHAVETTDTRSKPVRGRPLKRILLVDDNHDSTDALAALLESMDYQVAVAYSGAEAIERFGSFQPEAAVIDIGLPDINGFELARQFRSAKVSTLKKLIALTGWGTGKDIDATHAAGFDVHVTKPVTVEQIVVLLVESDDPPETEPPMSG